MKKIMISMLVLVGMLAYSNAADEKADLSKTSIVLSSGTGIASNIIAELSLWLKTSTKLPVVTRGTVGDVKDVETIAEKAVSSNAAEVVIVLVSLSDKKDFRMVVFPEKHVAVLNLDGYVDQGAKWSDRPDIFLLRVKREALKAQALMLGVKPCVFPLCAFSNYESLADLDWKGATPCPPCSGEYEKVLIKRGVVRE